jgi:ribosome-associated protein
MVGWSDPLAAFGRCSSPGEIRLSRQNRPTIRPSDHQTSQSLSSSSQPVMSAPARIPNNNNSFELAQRAAGILLERKANDVVLLSLEGVSDMTDYFLIASGTSDTHVRALGGGVLEDMKKELGQTAHHVEGLQQGRWVLLDYVDFVVHVFHPTLRNFYQIERLWADAEVIPITADARR